MKKQIKGLRKLSTEEMEKVRGGEIDYFQLACAVALAFIYHGTKEQHDAATEWWATFGWYC
jgi:hypothetical protein